ncbi:MAG: HlyD family type I secretion periplasmic adaptor subunit [Planctomycetes bacterium]|nr:HlyD family type I secretion periplasmic adaptor subunit [Planctomycetota bacterium]
MNFKDMVTTPAKLWRRLPEWSERGVSRSLQDFLPPSLEVLEKPPHPAPRVLLWLTVTIFLVGVIWAVIGKIDIITTAEGKIIPGGKVKVIQPLEKGVVSKILVRDGDVVQANQPLVELDQTQNLADRSRLENELAYVVHRLARREILAEWLVTEDPTSLSLPWVEEMMADDARNIDIPLLYEEWRALTADIETLRSQLAERRSEQRTSDVVIQQYEATLPLLQTRVDALEYLYNQKVVTKMEYYTLEEERQRQLHAHEAEKFRNEQLQSAITSVERQIAATNAKNLSDVLAQVDDLQRQERTLEQELAKAHDIGAKMVLASPVDGIIKGMAINTVGGVVNEAEILMEVVPLDEVLEVEAFVGNQDIGYVREGQIAEVKIHTFPFTRYGVIEGTVESVASDATVDEQQGLIYRTRLSLAKNSLMVDGRLTQLLPGMAITAEISTGERRLIEFFMAPLLRAKQESLRER